MLSLEDITCRFGTVVALDRVSMRVTAGSVHALLGENGAGKTTLMRVAFGLQTPTSGRIAVGGASHPSLTPAGAIANGIGMVHQHFTLVPAMTVAENVALGGTGRFDLAHTARRLRDVGERAGLVVDPSAVVATLSVGAQQRVEIVKALARNVQLLILDEPTAVLAPKEAAELLRWMRGFANAGGAVVLITHKLRDALQVADTVTVLRNGQVTLSAAVNTVTEPALMTAMVGTAAADVNADDAAAAATLGAGSAVSTAAVTATKSTSSATSPATSSTASSTAESSAPRPVVLRLHDVTVTDSAGATRVRHVSLTVHGGEVVGIAAVEGAGHHELLKVLAGRMPATSGDVMRPERVGYVPEDRHQDALMLSQPLYENVALKGAGDARGVMPWSAIRASTQQLLASASIVADGVVAEARTLSGGNQQKLVVARELADAPQALIVVNPSRGLDFLATRAVHRAVRSARDSGAAVVVYSSDLDEVLQLSDRVFAMFDGRLVEAEHDREALGNAMLGTSFVGTMSTISPAQH